MSWFSGIGDIFRNLGNVAKSGFSGLGNALSGPLSGMFNSGGSGGGSSNQGFYSNPLAGSFQTSANPTQASQAFGMGGSKFGGSLLNYNPGQPNMAVSNYLSPMGQIAEKSGGGGGFGNVMGAIGKLFTGGGQVGDFARGMGLMGLGALIPNAKAPSMPSAYNDYLSMMQQGGTPGMQSAGKYYESILSGNMSDPYLMAILDPINQAEEDEARQRTAMYKSLRPGSDPLSDAAWARDEAEAKTRWAQEKEKAVALAKFQAASGAAGLGQQQMSGLGGAIQSQLDNLATQWGLSSAKRQALMSGLMGVGGSMATNAIDPALSVLNKLFGRQVGG